MSRRNRIFFGLLLLYAAGVGWLLWQLLADIDPRYRESAEESLVETAHLMATLVEQRSAAAAEARAELVVARATSAEAGAALERARAAEAAASALYEAAAAAASASAAASGAASSAEATADAVPAHAGVPAAHPAASRAASAAAAHPPPSASAAPSAAAVGAAPSAPSAAAAAASPELTASAALIDTTGLDALFRNLYARRPDADIFGVAKNSIELRLVVVDASGSVRFDSTGRHEGQDYSQWRDIHRALAGEYGARTSPDIDGDAKTSVMYVAAPVRLGGVIVGAVSVGKPVQSFGQFVEAARRKTLLVGATSVAAVLLLAVILSVWLVRPFGLVADYLRYVRAQRSFSLPRLGRRALGVLGAAYDEMRDALAGRSYVADYVQTLTHELKSPLSAIRGAAELLHEADMPAADRQRFVANIELETQRIQELVNRMMELAALEQRRTLDHPEPVELKPLLQELAVSAEAAGAPRRLRVQLDAAGEAESATVLGDRLLLRRAVGNLLDNARDFSLEGGTIELTLRVRSRRAEISVRDHGPGIPDYADEKVFEKFFSLARPHTQRRSTGLGLPFVKEVAELHQGRVSLANAEGGGARAVLSLPVE